MEMQLGTLGISEIIPPLIIPPNVVKTFTTKTVIDQELSIGDYVLTNGANMVRGDRGKVYQLVPP